MGAGTGTAGAGASEREGLMELLADMSKNASLEDVHSVVAVAAVLGQLSKDSELTCSGNWDRQLEFKVMEREASRLVLFALLDMVKHGD